MGFFVFRLKLYELRKLTFVFLIAVALTFILYFKSYDKEYNNNIGYGIQPLKSFSTSISDLENHKNIVKTYYAARKQWKTSNLGAILFKNVNPYIPLDSENRRNKTYKVLVWRYWSWLKNRHIQNFGKANNSDILQDCSVKNCVFTGDDEELSKSDAVVIHMQRGIYPHVTNRNTKQRWIFLSDESPLNTFSLSKNLRSYQNLHEYANIFNWTMTLRSDADIPVPYGRTIPLHAPYIVNTQDPYLILEALVPNWRVKRMDVNAAILMSNCQKDRIIFLNKFKNHGNVDVYGKCGDKLKTACPGHFKADCELIEQYIFYLALENGMCHQYITEKVFWNAYSKGAIPVIVGPPLEDCLKLLPPNSFLHIDNYTSIKKLALHMEQIASSYDNILFYHKWRMHFKIVNEHGYFGTKSYHYCRVCQALNYNDGEISVYDTDDLKAHFDPTILCTKYKNLNK